MDAAWDRHCGRNPELEACIELSQTTPNEYWLGILVLGILIVGGLRLAYDLSQDRATGWRALGAIPVVLVLWGIEIISGMAGRKITFFPPSREP